ncbi:MAG: hypothetical protein QM784_33375 [Polyangiaceae bacterium]
MNEAASPEQCLPLLGARLTDVTESSENTWKIAHKGNEQTDAE